MDNALINSIKNKNCLILNLWACQNYGAILTCYGVYLLLNKIGFNSKIINYFPKEIFKERFEGSFVQDFSQKYFNLTKKIESDNDFYSLNNESDVFIVGSDQVWNQKIARVHHENASSNIYQLGFVEKGKKRLSLSASFGVDFFYGEEDEKQNFAKLIKKFDAISVREDSGVKILKDDFGVFSTQLIDGAFFINSDVLENLTSDFGNTDDKYIAVFTLPYYKNMVWYKKYLQKISDYFKLPLKVMDFDNKISVEKWLSFIKKSEFVVSDSYHAIIFSIIFNKPFVQLKNALAQSRFEALYKLLGVQACILDENIKEDNIQFFYENKWSSVNEKISKEIEKAEKWVVENIGM